MENITNVRDLGGMKGAGGKHIKPKRLIRSSALYNLSDNDVNLLTNDLKVKNIVDFRTDIECNEKPDDYAKIKNVNYNHFTSFDTFQETITRDERSTYMLLENSENLTVEQAIKIIEDFYDYITTIPSMQIAYKKYFEVLLNCNEGSTIWHCSLGKDRAGIAAVLIEYVLGVSYKDILKDYLLTNESLDQTVERKKNNAFRVFYGVQESFLTSWFDSVEKNYGSVEGYLEESLNVGGTEIAQLRDMYLE